MNNNNNNNNLSSFLVNKFIANFGKKMYKNDCLFACLGLSDFLYEEKAFKLREEEEEEEEGWEEEGDGPTKLKTATSHAHGGVHHPSSLIFHPSD